MSNGEWARTSITVWRGSAEPQVQDMASGTLEEQLRMAEAWLGELGDTQRAELHDDLEVRLFLLLVESR